MLRKAYLIHFAAIATVTAAFCGAYALTGFADAVWDAADAKCKALGKNCCAVAGVDGKPKYTDGILHCTCGGAILADFKKPGGLTLADRKAHALKNGEKKLPAEKKPATGAAKETTKTGTAPPGR